MRFAVVSYVVELPDDQPEGEFQDATEAARLAFAFGGMKASKARVEIRQQPGIAKAMPKPNAPGPKPVPGRLS